MKSSIHKMFYVLIGLIPGLLVSVAISGYYNVKIFELQGQHSLMSSVNAGNSEDEILARKGYTHIFFEPEDNLEIPGFQPVPSNRDADKVIGIQKGHFLIYAFIKDGYVTATFYSEKQ